MGQEYISFLYTKSISNKVFRPFSHKIGQNTTCFYSVKTWYLKGTMKGTML